MKTSVVRGISSEVVCHDMIWYDVVCVMWYVWYSIYGMMWYDMVCMIWYGVVWCGIV